MEKKSMYLKIFLGVEIIVALRILLFVVPVVINNMNTAGKVYSIEDWFFLSIAIPAVFYFIVGLLAFLGNSLWRFLHYLIVFMTCFLTTALVAMAVRMQSPVIPYYFLPAVVSLLVLGFVLYFKKQESGCSCSHGTC